MMSKNRPLERASDNAAQTENRNNISAEDEISITEKVHAKVGSGLTANTEKGVAPKKIDTQDDGQQQAIAHLRKKYNRLLGFINNTPNALLTLDSDHHILTLNKQFRKIVGLPASACVDASFLYFLSPESKVQFVEKISTLVIDEVLELNVTVIGTERRNSNMLALFTRFEADADHEQCQTIVALVDTTRQQNIESQLRTAKSYLERLANNDPLTGLPNRMHFNDALRSAMLNARTSDKKIALLYFDLDGFKKINDQHGHQAGDALLCEIANRLRTRIRDVERLARVGGDEFTLIFEYTGDFSPVMQEAESILDVVSMPVRLPNVNVAVSSSIGVSIYPTNAKTPDELVRQADAAMYQAKEAGRGQVRLYCAALKQKLMRRHDIETGVLRGIEQSEFYVDYQAIVSAQSRECASHEVLARWNHPRFGVLLPDDFIPIAERTGEILSLGYWVFENTCKKLEYINDSGFNTRMAVNLSPIQLEKETTTEQIMECLNRYNVSAGDIEFELTESSVINNLDECIYLASSLSERGFNLSIDDFGTGYSSLSRLVDLPVSKLKIDRMLIKDIENRKQALAIVKGVTNIAHDLGMSVVAEGVENAQQADILTEIECDFLQGFGISKPSEQLHLSMLGKSPADISSVASL